MENKNIQGFENNGYIPKVAVPDYIGDLKDGGRVTTNENNISTLQGQVSNINTELSTKASVTYVDNKFNGAAKAIAYDSYSTMITAFNALGADVYAIGQDVLIQTLEVPDLWVSSIESSSVTYTYVDDATFTAELAQNGYVQVGYYRLSALETQKVDLTGYQEKLTAGTNITIDAQNVISASGGTTDAVLLDTTAQTFNGSKTLKFNEVENITFCKTNNTSEALQISFFANSVGLSVRLKNNDFNWLNFYPPKNTEDAILNVRKNNSGYNQTIQAKSGTIALTSDITAKVPDAPTADGTYVLKVVVSNGTPTYQWVLDV